MGRNILGILLLFVLGFAIVGLLVSPVAADKKVPTLFGTYYNNGTTNVHLSGDLTGVIGADLGDGALLTTTLGENIICYHSIAFAEPGEPTITNGVRVKLDNHAWLTLCYYYVDNWVWIGEAPDYYIRFDRETLTWEAAVE